MLGIRLGLLAAGALISGVAGCALPHALPVEGGTTAGPSPYGVWYEQHWATNSVLLAASDNPEADVQAVDDSAVEVTIEEDSVAVEQLGDDAAVDAGAESAADVAEEAAQRAEDFSNSTPYQFPASSFAPAAPETDEPIRY
ncbi:MAG: hypothetical protein ABR587_09055 [Candidatus Binatia bacterium]